MSYLQNRLALVDPLVLDRAAERLEVDVGRHLGQVDVVAAAAGHSRPPAEKVLTERIQKNIKFANRSFLLLMIISG